MKTNYTWGLFCLVFTSVIGLGVGMMFVWLALMEYWHFMYFVVGFIMTICGMFATALFIEYRAYEEDKISH